MANVQHVNATDPNIHEPKGVAAASANTMYIADGGGSGSWAKAGPSNLTDINNVNIIVVTHKLIDISTAHSEWVIPGIAGDITAIKSVLDGAITGANATISFEIGGVAVTNGNLTITQSGSTAGDVDTSTPTATNTITASQPIEIITDGGSTGTQNLTITFLIDIS